MIRQILTVIILLPLFGCVHASEIVPGTFAWDGLGRDPNRQGATFHFASRTRQADDPNVERTRILSGLHPYSAAWWAVNEEIEGENDRRTNAKLIICKGCLETH